MPYKLRMVVDQLLRRHWRYTWYRDPPGYREEGDHCPSHVAWIPGRASKADVMEF